MASQKITPTNTISFESQQVRARIDPTLPSADVVRQLCASFAVPQIGEGGVVLHALWTLDGDVLVTDDNMRSLVAARSALRLGPSPFVLASTTLASIADPDTPASARKLALFSLNKHLKEKAFVRDFVALEGERELFAAAESLDGNSLAYALQAIQALCEQSQEPLTIPDRFLRRLISVLVSEAVALNVTRPASSVLRYSIGRAGFDQVWTLVRQEETFLKILVGRLASSEAGECANALKLLNSLMSAAGDGSDVVTRELDQLGVRKLILRLMRPPSNPDLASPLLDFQSNIVRATFQRHRSSVDTASNPEHSRLLNEVWSATGLDVRATAQERATVLGLEVQTGRAARAVFTTGLLGLECFHHFASTPQNGFQHIIVESLALEEDRRCPFGQASNEVVEILLEHWDVSDFSTATRFQPLLLSFSGIHSILVLFFLKMWNDSSASRADFTRVGALVRAVVKRTEDLEKAMDVEYRDARELVLGQATAETELYAKPAIRALKASIFEDSYVFIKQQRIGCLIDGAWFQAGVSSFTKEPGRAGPLGFVFLRLTPNLKSLAFIETQHQLSVKPSLEELSERIDLSLITEIATRTSTPATAARANGRGRSAASELSFSLLTGEISLLDVVALDSSQFAEWVDAISLLKSDSARVATEETKLLIEHLTEMGLQVKLLDLTGETVQVVPDQLSIPPLPSNWDFHFADVE